MRERSTSPTDRHPASPIVRAFSDALELLLCFYVLTKLFVQVLRRI